MARLISPVGRAGRSLDWNVRTCKLGGSHHHCWKAGLPPHRSPWLIMSRLTDPLHYSPADARSRCRDKNGWLLCPTASSRRPRGARTRCRAAPGWTRLTGGEARREERQRARQDATVHAALPNKAKRAAAVWPRRDPHAGNARLPAAAATAKRAVFWRSVACVSRIRITLCASPLVQYDGGYAAEQKDWRTNSSAAVR